MVMQIFAESEEKAKFASLGGGRLKDVRWVVFVCFMVACALSKSMRVYERGEITL
jgi:hypothetical protein